MIRPWLAEWEAAKAQMGAALEKERNAEIPQREDQGAPRGAGAVPRLPRPSQGVPGAGPGLRLGQLPLSRPAGAEGFGAPRQHRSRGDGFSARVPRHRPGLSEGARN